MKVLMELPIEVNEKGKLVASHMPERWVKDWYPSVLADVIDKEFKRLYPGYEGK